MIAAALVANFSAASDPAPSRTTIGSVRPLDLEPIDQTVADTGPLSMSLRNMKRDLRLPVSFEEVYRVPGHGDLLMRVSGGLYAIFPRSVYMPVRGGLRPVVPHGTIFHIGEPNPMLLASDGAFAPRESGVDAASDRRVVARVETSALPAERAGGLVEGSNVPRSVGARRPAADPVAAPTPSRTELLDPGYRVERFRTLLRRAVEAARSAETQG